MSLIADTIERAHAADLVLEVSLDADRCDVYVIRTRFDRSLTVWVRPDGRFSRARMDGRLITLGQVGAQLGVYARSGARPPR